MNGLHCIVFVDMIFQDIHLDNISQFMPLSLQPNFWEFLL